MFQMCCYHHHACLLVCLSPACLSVSQTSMDDSGHKENTGQLLNSSSGYAVSNNLIYLSLSQSYIVCTPPPLLQVGG